MIFSAYKQYGPLTVLLLLLVAIWGIIWFGVFPLEQSVQNKMRAIQEFYAARENRERQVKKLPELQSQYDTLLANEQILNILISEDAVVDFVKTIEELAKTQHITLSITSKDGGKVSEPKKIAVKPKVNDDENEEVPVSKNSAKALPVSIMDTIPYDRYLSLSVKAEGRYRDIVAFLGKLETLPFGLDVIGIEIKRKEKEREAVPSGNPFVMIGDGGGVSGEPVTPEITVEEDILEAVFDLLVYVKKTGV